MAFWWVSQNQSYDVQRAGGYLWAPRVNKAGNTPSHWKTMLDVRPGDLVFSYVDQEIKSFSLVLSEAVESRWPPEFKKQDLWEQEGYRVDVQYQDIPSPIVLSNVVDEFYPLLGGRNSPLNRNRTGNQGYLFPLPPRAGQFLLDHIGTDQPEVLIEQAVERSSAIIATERTSLLRSRLGQGRFRDGLIRVWDGKCSTTGCQRLELLRASHIKPWRDANNAERLDPYNGLLLTPNFDAAFDAGLISFSQDGRVIISDSFHDECEALGISPVSRLRWVDDRHKPFLAYHQDVIFRQ